MKISATSAGRKKSRREKTQIFLCWLCFTLLGLAFYVIMVCGLFRNFQPALIISLAAAVALFEKEVSSAVFGTFCGFMLDTATRTLFGFSSMIMMLCCLAISLLVRHLIKVNLLNHLLLTAGTCLAVGFMDYFFNYKVWGGNSADVILKSVLIPSYVSAVALAPPVFLIVRKTFVKFYPKSE